MQLGHRQISGNQQSIEDVVNLFTSIVKKQNLFSLHIIFKLKINHHIPKSSKPLFPVDNGGCRITMVDKWRECWQS